MEEKVESVVYNTEPVAYTEVKESNIEVPELATVVVPEASAVPKTDLRSYASLIAVIITLIGTFSVTVLGWEPLPYSNEEVNYAVIMVLQVISTIWAWFRNNNVTKHGKQRQAIADQVIPQNRNEG